MRMSLNVDSTPAVSAPSMTAFAAVVSEADRSGTTTAYIDVAASLEPVGYTANYDNSFGMAWLMLDTTARTIW
jgi:hypothetical protein